MLPNSLIPGETFFSSSRRRASLTDQMVPSARRTRLTYAIAVSTSSEPYPMVPSLAVPPAGSGLQLALSVPVTTSRDQIMRWSKASYLRVTISKAMMGCCALLVHR